MISARTAVIVLAILMGGIVRMTHGVPWSETEFKIGTSPEESSGWLPAIPVMQTHYEQRFGNYPDVVIWEDLTLPCYLTWYVAMDTDTAKMLKWEDLQPHLFFKLQSVRTAKIMYSTLHDSTLQWVEGPDEVYKNESAYFFMVRMDKLPVPMDSSAWQVSLEIWEGQPTSGKRLSVPDMSPFVVRTKRETPSDTLMWAMEKKAITDNPDLCRLLLRHFPENRWVLGEMVDYSEKLKQCDSMYVYTGRLLNTLKHRLDPFYMDFGFLYEDGIDPDPGPPPLTTARFNQLLKRLLNACGDTTGLSQYAP